MPKGKMKVETRLARVRAALESMNAEDRKQLADLLETEGGASITAEAEIAGHDALREGAEQSYVLNLLRA